MNRRTAYRVAAVVTVACAPLALVLIFTGHRLAALAPIAVVAVCAEIIRRTADALESAQ